MDCHNEIAKRLSPSQSDISAKLSCTVRNSRESDMAGFQRTYAFHVLHGLASFGDQPPSVDELNGRRADVLGRRLPYLVAELDRDVLGYSYAARYRSRPAYRITAENSVYVDHRLAGRGVGGLLLSSLMGRCIEAGCHQMVVVGNSANTAPIALHRRTGFRHVGTLHSVGFKFGRWVDSVLMQRAVATGLPSGPTVALGASDLAIPPAPSSSP